MRSNLDGKSLFTGDIAILLYYACALIGLCTGFLAIVALLGAIVSRMIAKKEGAVLVTKHCSWIANSIWFSIFAVTVVTIAVITVLGTGDLNAFDNIQTDTIEQLMENPGMQSFLLTLGAGIVALVPLLIWYVYRIVRGVLGVLNARAPK